jgi:hypothetical protein
VFKEINIRRDGRMNERPGRKGGWETAIKNELKKK